MQSLVETLDLLDLAIGRARGVVPDDVLDGVATTAAHIRSRRGFLGDVLVLALAGGTGSGKSSILNALAGAEITSVSPLRPHTDRPLAWVPGDAFVDIRPLLDELGVEDRAVNDQLPGLVVVDLPDMDSIAEWHRHTVDQLLPRVDAVLWVFDPIKYHDPVLHAGFLGPLAAYHRQFIFVLNQMDTLDPDDRALVQSHLVSILQDDGYPAPRVIATAAAPETGSQIGIEDLIKHIDHRLDVKIAALTKIAQDLLSAAASLAEPEGLWEGWRTGFTGVGDDPGAAVRSLAASVGPTTAARLRATLVHAEPAQVEEAVTEVLWERAHLGATVASLGLAATALMASLDARRLP